MAITSQAWYQPNANAGGAEGSNLPSWMKAAIANVGNIGPGAASYVSSSGPQDISALQKIWDQSYGKAQSQLDPAAIKNLFSDSISAAMKLGGEQINSAAGERGAAVRPGGVETQKMMDLGLKVQQPLVEALLGNMNTGLQFNQNSLKALFDSASGPQANSLGYRNTTQDINSQLPPYVKQSDPNSSSSSSGGGGGKSGVGGPQGSGGSVGTAYDPKFYAGTGTGNIMGDEPTYPDWWDQPGYPGGSNEGPGTTNPFGGGGGLGALYDDADQPGGAADGSWVSSTGYNMNVAPKKGDWGYFGGSNVLSEYGS